MAEDEPIASVDTVGQQLRAAREAKGLSIEDVASATRIPTRHLESLEESRWDRLPAATYSVGFAKNYASAVGLDRGAIADQLRAEMGSELPAHYSTVANEPYEPIDGNRTMPKGLVIGAIIGLIALVALLGWLNNRELNGADSAATAPAEDMNLAATAAAPVAQGPVVLTANEAVWIAVTDRGRTLRQGELGPGQSFEVPATATAPLLTTGKPEALRISVGTGDAPAIGPAGQRVSGVSLLAADLMRGPAASPAASSPSVSAPPATNGVAPAPGNGF